jgi:hypothetical protein
VERQMRPEQAALMQTLQQRLANGLPPSQVASQVFAAMRAGQFYILTHPELKELVRQRMEDILLERNPTLLDIL